MITARFFMTCESCQRPIEKGDPIEKSEGRWRHLDCSKLVSKEQAEANIRAYWNRERKRRRAS